MQWLSNTFGSQWVLIGCCLLLLDCQRHQHEEAKGAFSICHPWRQAVTIVRSYVAKIQAIQHIEIRAFEKGYLQEIFVDEGQLIHRGDKIFQIMPLLMNAEYEKAKAELEISKIEYSNTAKLASQKVVSANELALAKAKVDKYTAELNLAKTHLDLTTLRAPFDGIIDKFRVRLGSLITEGDLLTYLADIRQLWVYFNLSEADYLAYMKKKQQGSQVVKVRLALANGEPYQHEGIIDAVEADFDSETGNILFRATFPNPDMLLRHGETGNVLLSDEVADALVIPQQATFEIIDKRYVYVLNPDHVIEAREIVVAKEVPHLFVIKSGVQEQDQILLEGIGKLRKGQKIESKLLTQEQVLKQLELSAQ